MPNTLAHIGVQGLFSRVAFSRADFKWVLLGCVLPDVPWILRRVFYALGSDIAPYDLKLYFLVQSSLLFCVVLCGVLSTVSRHSFRVFTILALNCLVHLLLDATQIKWGNGVHLFAPFSWRLLNFELFWPESPPSMALTLLGLPVFAYIWIKQPPSIADLAVPGAVKASLGAVLMAVYLVLPVFLMAGPEAADNRYIGTLRNPDQRSGKYIELDREFYALNGDRGIVRTWEGEAFSLPAPDGSKMGLVSVKATLTDSHTLKVHDIHFHPRHRREAGSYIGLALVALFWIRGLWPGRGDPMARAGGRGHQV